MKQAKTKKLIRKKLMAALFITSSAGLLITSAIFTLFLIISLKNDVENEMRAHARHTGASCVFSLSFENTHDAKYILEGLGFLPGFESVAIYRNDGSLFTEHTSPGGEPLPRTFVLGESINKNVSRRVFAVNEPIYSGKDILGSILIAYNMNKFDNTLRHSSHVVLGGLAVALLIAYLIGRRFQHTISSPIEALSSTARSVAQTANFTLRADIHAKDEIGQLSKNFNHMLAEIQKRDQKLLSNEARFRTLVDEAVDAILLIQQNGILVDCNPMAANSLLYSKTGLLHRVISEIIPELTPDAFQNLWETSFSGAHPTINATLLREDGTTYPAEIKLGPIRQQNGNLLIAFCRDITKRLQVAEQLKKTEESLQQSQKMDSIGQLAGGIAHDFNNMLSGIVSSAELLKLLAENDQSQRYLDLILSAAKQASGLTEKLLTFSRKGSLEHASFGINTTVRDAIAILEHSIDPRIQIIENYDSDHHFVSGDSALIQSVILNLAINARDAMGDEGTLTVTTGTTSLSEEECLAIPFDIIPGNHVFIEIHDTGCGISEELQKRIFEPFFTTKDVGKGTGMGLSAVYGTIQNHHGAILVESEEGVGSKFTVLLPLSDEMPANETTSTNIITSKAGNGCILLIDDEEIIRTVVPEMLEKIGYMTLTAKNGEEGIRKFLDNEEHIELVILDMVMPVMDGATCLSGLKRINPDIKIIVSSGYTQNTSTSSLKQEGVAAFIKKPFEYQTLRETITTVLGTSEEPESASYRPDIKA
jgi:PAS domain S-box-containing protein